MQKCQVIQMQKCFRTLLERAISGPLDNSYNSPPRVLYVIMKMNFSLRSIDYTPMSD